MNKKGSYHGNSAMMAFLLPVRCHPVSDVHRFQELNDDVPERPVCNNGFRLCHVMPLGICAIALV